jgi:ribosomal protein S18 acetylase RimI-like enzyme
MPNVLEPSWVGRRVSVRRVLGHDAGGRPQFGDVVGDLAGLDAQTAVIETTTGLTELALDGVVAARLVPPSTAQELALEAVAARGLRPADTEQLGGWLLRADHGFTHRANSVLPLRAPGMPLDDALQRAADWYAARGLPLMLHVPVEARRLLDAELGERGWPVETPAQVLVCRLAAAPESSVAVTITDRPDDEWLAIYRGGRGLADSGRALLARHDRVAFAAARLDGRTVAVVRGAVDEGWLGVMALEVDPGYRRQGLATALMHEIHRWAIAHGARRGYLQVAVENVDALDFYERLGYWVHHDYHYRRQP